MGRPRLPKAEKRVRVPVNVAPDVLLWVDNHVGVGKRWQTRSHAFEFAVAKLMQEDKRATKD